MSAQPQKSTSKTAQAQPAQTAAEGHYTHVAVHPNLGGSGSLSNGTGTMSAIGVFSCGPFDANNRPEIGKTSNITGNPDLNLVAWKCVYSGPTSDFKAQ